MDLASLDMEAAADKGATLTLRHPRTDEDLTDDNGKPMTVTVLGAESGEFKRIIADLHRKAQGRKKSPTLAEQERQTVDMLVRVTTGWDGIQWEGKALAFNAENCRMVYAERPWIRRQVDEFIADAANFPETALSS